MLFNEQALSELIAQGRVDAVVATSSQNVVLLSGYGTWLEEKLRGWMSNPAAEACHCAGFAVLDSALRVGLVASPLFVEATQMSLASHVAHPERGVTSTGREAADALVSVITAMGIDDGRLGVEFDGAPAWLRAHLATALPRAVLRDCSLLLRLARMRKSPTALARLRDVATITHKALTEVLAHTPEPRHLSREFRLRLARSDADLDHIVYGLPGNGGLSLGGSATTWASGLTYLDAGARRDHFYSDTGLTVLKGELGRSDKERYSRICHVLEAGSAAVLPGVRCSAVLDSMRGAAAADPAIRPQGHGLGLDIRELPTFGPPQSASVSDETVTAPADTLLEEQMVVNLEVSAVYSDCSIQLERTLEVRAGGSIVIGQPLQLETVG